MEKSEELKTLLVTSNLGTAGEVCTDDVLNAWTADVRKLVAEEEPDVLALHFQEVGGKSYNSCFTEKLRVTLPFLFEDALCTGLMMHDENDEFFTAVGAAVFVSTRVRHRVSCPPSDSFTARKFEGAGASRKGWVGYSLRIDGNNYRLLSTHLFAESDNRDTFSVSAEGGTMTPTAERRARAFFELVRAEMRPELHPENTTFVVAGDLNFRVDGRRFVESVKKSVFEAEVTVGKKLFSWGDSQDRVSGVIRSAWKELRPCCREGEALIDETDSRFGVALTELPVAWPPTFPLQSPSSYSSTRLPAWTDRVFFTPSPSMLRPFYGSKESALDHAMVYLSWHTAATVSPLASSSSSMDRSYPSSDSE